MVGVSMYILKYSSCLGFTCGVVLWRPIVVLAVTGSMLKVSLALFPLSLSLSFSPSLSPFTSPDPSPFSRPCEGHVAYAQEVSITAVSTKFIL